MNMHRLQYSMSRVFGWGVKEVEEQLCRSYSSGPSTACRQPEQDYRTELFPKRCGTDARGPSNATDRSLEGIGVELRQGHVVGGADEKDVPKLKEKNCFGSMNSARGRCGESVRRCGARVGGDSHWYLGGTLRMIPMKVGKSTHSGVRLSSSPALPKPILRLAESHGHRPATQRTGLTFESIGTNWDSPASNTCAERYLRLGASEVRRESVPQNGPRLDMQVARMSEQDAVFSDSDLAASSLDPYGYLPPRMDNSLDLSRTRLSRRKSERLQSKYDSDGPAQNWTRTMQQSGDLTVVPEWNRGNTVPNRRESSSQPKGSSFDPSLATRHENVARIWILATDECKSIRDLGANVDREGFGAVDTQGRDASRARTTKAPMSLKRDADDRPRREIVGQPPRRSSRASFLRVDCTGTERVAFEPLPHLHVADHHAFGVRFLKRWDQGWS
ncbi:hypothetical protein C8R43DRAFT_1113783 [Mycena crocata]|nr:hypothetical protein C8R43DRAFT_1113783 [Mycena crocata]